MATAYHNLSEYDASAIPSTENMRFGIVVSEWNPDVTERLLAGAYETLQKHGVTPDQIEIQHVPGSFELVFGAKLLAEKCAVDAVIVLGAVVRGGTPHFDYVCQGVTQGVTQLNISQSIPVIFGLLTTDTMQQALDRAGGIHGNKGDEAAITAIKMVHLKRSI
ncbi:6,7-dimethyl-8-ribityllumazine synthase [Microbacter margulisiae]|uniref:6,7-dimethyl-8-ribityllumazine synthase n=1 Tax=Microbacter margulisiae TaxID=1350067 RepID=A0A7W5H361_9PORP|nr:6,7-dimethyl-8-ribityllumazine synthase [Microbacter margulisiae]MBB3188269.1 6,7-dimethyl-8-ribityllumazine synthase [Microbacter margulisiae]